MVINWDPEVYFSAHLEAFLDLPKRWGADWLIRNMSVVIQRDLHGVFPGAHHRDLDIGAGNLEVLKRQLARPSVVHKTHIKVERVRFNNTRSVCMSESLTICTDATYSGLYCPNQVDQPTIHSRLGRVTHKVNRKHKMFEVLAFQCIEYTAFLREREESKGRDSGPVPCSVIGLPRPRPKNGGRSAQGPPERKENRFEQGHPRDLRYSESSDNLKRVVEFRRRIVRVWGRATHLYQSSFRDKILYTTREIR